MTPITVSLQNWKAPRFKPDGQSGKKLKQYLLYSVYFIQYETLFYKHKYIQKKSTYSLGCQENTNTIINIFRNSAVNFQGAKKTNIQS